VAKPDCTYADAIENIDIGGPAMVRAASKNHESVTVIVDPADYAQVLGELDANDGATSIDTRSSLAAKAFAHTAKYDTMVSNYLLRRESEDAASLPATLPLVYEKIQDLRYGEIRIRRPRSIASRGFPVRAWPTPPCSRARSCRSTTSRTPTPQLNACACSTNLPA
jgi:AICAR transformylase/IMP cyclohydrolase PurH